MKSLFPYLLSVFFTLVFYSCSQPGSEKFTDTPTSGRIGVTVDESYSLLFDTQAYTFQALYPNAHLIVRYKPEEEAIKDLMTDSSKVAVLNRQLTDEENQEFEKLKIFPKTVKIASDAVALIVNPAEQDTTMTVKQLKRYLSGEDTVWAGNRNQKMRIVFDNPQSANYRYMRKLINGQLQKNCFAVKSNPEVIEYVSKNPGTLGIISVNWISDKDDTLSQMFLKKIKVVALTGEEIPNELTKFRKPLLAYMVNGEYPLTRDVFMINRQTRAGLGTGFVSFVAGEKGQRMMKLAGLVPATFQVRLVEFKK